MPWF